MKLLIPLAGCFSLLAVFNPTSVFAHPGHGDPQHQTGVLHYLSSPTHWAPVAAVVVIVAAIWVARKSRTASTRSTDRPQDRN